MSILELLPVSSMLDSPFTDYLNVTFPLDYEEQVLTSLLPIIESLGPFSEVDKGVYRLFDRDLKPTRGVIKFSRKGKVAIVSASGAALATLRDCRAYEDYLFTMGTFPHRVSMIHCTQDYFVPDPSPVILAVKKAAFAEELRLTRKRILKGQVRALTSPNAQGNETGTVYLANRANADIWAKVYDKQQERISRGCADPGPIVRVEVAVQSDAGATLKDAHNPFNLFFQFASKTLVAAPPSFRPWVPSGEGFTLGDRQAVLPFSRLERFIENSLDLVRLVDLSVAAYGATSGAMLARVFHEKCQRAFSAAQLA